MIDEDQLTELTAWLTEAGLTGQSELALVIGFCERAVAAGLPLARAHVLIDTLDPVHEGHVFRWGHDASLPPEQGYGRTSQIIPSGGLEPAFVPTAAHADAWRRPFHRMLETGESVLRRRIQAASSSGGFGLITPHLS